MSNIPDTIHLDTEDFTLFTPHYSNLKAAEIISSVDKYVFQRGIRKYNTKKEELLEVVIYNCFLTCFSIKLSQSDYDELRELLFYMHPREYRIFGEWLFIPFQYFYKSYVSTLFIEKVCKLNKRNLSIVIHILLEFLNINDQSSWSNFYKSYILHQHKYTFETYEDSLRAFRTFLVWFDIELSQIVQKTRGKDYESFSEIQVIIKKMIEMLPGVINLDEEHLPQNYIELIRLYNPAFGELIEKNALEI